MSNQSQTDHEAIIEIKGWIWGPGPNRDNGANASIKALWAVVRRIDRTILIATGAMIILQPLLIAALVKWLV